MNESRSSNPRPPATKQRKKASSACVSCRARRTKCNIEPGETVCAYCQRNNMQCVFQDDDERKKSASKAHIMALSGRVQMLEGLLKVQNQPAGNAPNDESNYNHEKTFQTESNNNNKPPLSAITPPTEKLPSIPENHFQETNSMPQQQQQQQQQINDSPQSRPDQPFSSAQTDHSTPNSSTSGNTTKPVVAHLVETVGNLGGGLGSVEYDDRASMLAANALSESREQRRQTDRILEDIPPDTDAYLISLFFQYGNSMLLIVDQEAFLHDKARGGSRSYSGFLHIVLLAMGLRYADHTRPDVARYVLPNRESTLHKGARYLVEYELQCQGGIPSVQALLLLGDLEAACGKDNTGWMYGGMAIRLCFDMGLNLPPKPNLARWELRNWRAALWACYIHDRYWSFYLGRPTSMKRTDIVASRLMHENQSLDDQIFSALINLMDLFTEITDNVEDANKIVNDETYVFMTKIYRKLNNWYAELPLALQWNATNIETAPSSFFLLHQQYHSSLILLHRPLAQYNNPDVHEDRVKFCLALVSRSICFENAMKLAQIFARLRLRFDIRKVYFSAVQHAGTAATALINGLSLIEDPAERVTPLQHLQTLYKALQDMSLVYQPADHMSRVLSHGFVVARWNTRDCPVLSSKVQQQWQLIRSLSPNKRAFSSENEPAQGSGSSSSSLVKRRRENDMEPLYEQQQAEISFPQLFESNVDISSLQPHLDMSSEQFSDREQWDAGMDIVFRSDLREGNWEPMPQLSPLIQRRANFLDMTSGFDQLFQSTGDNV